MEKFDYITKNNLGKLKFSWRQPETHEIEVRPFHRLQDTVAQKFRTRLCTSNAGERMDPNGLPGEQVDVQRLHREALGGRATLGWTALACDAH